MSLLEIKNLHATVNGNEILKGVDLSKDGVSVPRGREKEDKQHSN